VGIRLTHRITKACASVLTASICAVAAPFVAAPDVAHAGTAAAFGCEPGFYQVLSGHLKQLDFVSSTYTDVGPNPGLGNYNAMGYNQVDDFLYATRNATNGVIRIYSDGSVEELGDTTPTLPASGWFGGDFDGNGNLYLNNTSGVWAKVNVSAMTSESLTLTGSASLADFGIIAGVAYGIATGSNTLTRVNLSTLVVTTVSVPGLPSGTYGAVFVSDNSNLYVSDNADGQIYQIQGYTTSAPTATEYAVGGPTSSNDGAACPSAQNPGGVPALYTVSFDLGGGSGTTPENIGDLEAGDVSTLPDGAGFSRDGFDFDGWDCEPLVGDSLGEIAAGANLTQPASDVVCTALWTPADGSENELPATGSDEFALMVALATGLAGSVVLMARRRGSTTRPTL